MERSGRLVVVADDNLFMATSLRLLLEFWKFSVTIAHDGLAALDVIRARQPAAALLDLRMPMLDGLEVARRIRADTGARSVLLVSMTGLGNSAARSAATSAGFDAHLVKPFDAGTLRALLPEP